MRWTYNSILDHEGYKQELDKLNNIKKDMKVLQDKCIKLDARAEDLKQKSLEGNKTTWEDVQKARHEIEKAEYRIKVLKVKRDEQQKLLNIEAQKAREKIIKEVEQKKIETLKKSLKAYELLEEAYKDDKEIEQYQQKALHLTGREYTRNKAKIPLAIPNPAVQNIVWDIWLKKANNFLKGKKIS